jgi:hypothetical protein
MWWSALRMVAVVGESAPAITVAIGKPSEGHPSAAAPCASRNSMRFRFEDGAAGAHTALTAVFLTRLAAHAPASQDAAILTVVLEH